MDTFMDKLAQKLTAQEMIKANSAADTEELHKLRNQITEYNACLAQMQEVNKELKAVNQQMGQLMSGTIAPQMQKLVEAGVIMLDQAKVDGSEINRLVEESIAKIKEIQQNTEAIEELRKQNTTTLEELKQQNATTLEELKQQNAANLDALKQQNTNTLEELRKQNTDTLQEMKQQSNDALQGLQQEYANTLEEFKQQVNEKLDGSNENVHKECVKVYRNVQAVIVEENTKQTESLSGIVGGLKGKMNAIFGVSIAALVVAAISLILQIVPFFF